MSDEAAFKLHLAEYQALRAEILAQQSIRATTFQYGIGGIVAIWAFLLTEAISPSLALLAIFAWWMPVLVALAGLALNFSVSSGVKQAGAYLAMIEQKYGVADLRGWENSLIRLKEAEFKPDRKAEAETERAHEISEIERLRQVLHSREISDTTSKIMRAIWKIITAVTALVASGATYLILANTDLAMLTISSP